MYLRARFLEAISAAVLPLPLPAFFLAPESLLIFVLAGAIGALCALLAARRARRKIAGRLSALENAARRIGQGDFAARVAPGANQTADELTRLENSFNRMSERLVEKRDRFTELDRMKSDFVSNVSHELRTPLTTIKALTRLLLRGELPEEKRREYLETISVECDRQIDLVLNLLDLSRIEGGVYRIFLERVDPAAVIRSCVKSEAAAAEKRRHRLEIEPFGDLPAACADPKALRRVVSNLIENAIKYTPDGGSIVLRADRDDDFVRIGVVDNGPGIPPEDLPVLFDKFHRGRPAPSSIATRDAAEDAAFLEDADVSGVGLGLYLARNVMERMGGRIRVETEVGRGSTFTLHLPVWTADGCGNSNGEKTNGEKTKSASRRDGEN